MNGLKVFKSEEFGEIRTIQLNNITYFVGKDVAEALGYVKARNAIATHVLEEDKKDAPIQGDLGGTQEMTVINESGLYALIFGSKLELAKRFKHWVTSEVLPSIRNNGGYIIGQENMTESELMAKALLVAQKTMDSLKDRCRFLGEQVTQQQKVIEEMQPKVSYYDAILQCKDLIATTIIAKDYGMSAKEFNSMLHKMEIQFRQGDIWVLYAKYQGNGYMKTKTHNYVGSDGEQHFKEHSYWTQKGRLFLYEMLKGNGVVPVMER